MAKRVDANQAVIIAGLREFGASVQCLHTIGKGCPDILVGFRGRNYPMEIKYGNARLTPAEQEWRNNWKGDCYVIRTIEEAIDLLNWISEDE
jgi:hypothetical protein